MKKFKIFSVIFVLLIGILIALSFVKLPIKLLTNQTIQEETKGIVSLVNAESQSLLFLPVPKIELTNSKFSINHPTVSLDLFTPNIEFSRSIFDKSHISINSNKISLENINSELFINTILLEDEIEDLKIQIETKNNSTEIKSNKFDYKGAEFSFISQFIENELSKIIFSIEDLDINDLVLLLDEQYQKYFKEINFASLSLGGEYTLDTIILENFKLNMQDGSVLIITGSIDTNNLINSDIDIQGNDLSSSTLTQLFNNFGLIDIIPKLPNGIVDNIDISLNNRNIKINNFNFKTNLGTSLNLKGDLNSFIFSDNNLQFEVKSTSSLEVIDIASSFIANINIPNLTFNEFDAKASMKDGKLIISSLIIKDEQTVLESTGSIDLDNINDRNLEIKLSNFNEIDLIPFPKFIELMSHLNIKNINFDGFLSGSNLEISQLQFLEDNQEVLVVAGETDFNNWDNSTFLNINFENISSAELQKIVSWSNQSNYQKYVESYNFEEIQGSLFLDLESDAVIINDISLYLKDKEIGKLTGKILDNKFIGDIDVEGINLSVIDKNFLKTDRLNGLLNLQINSPSYINNLNIIDLIGTIDGEIIIDVTDDELALIFFMQSLSQDIEDLEQINQLLNTLSKSFVNQPIEVKGSIDNPVENQLFLKNLSLTASNGKVINGEIEYNNSNFNITLFDIIDKDDFVIKLNNGNFSYERITADGNVRKPLEELFQKNINKLFENLLQ